MIHFINGRSGSGKSTLLLDIICKKAKAMNTQDENKIVLIVPEQSSFQNESEILNRLGAKYARNIEVLSLQRLCDYVERLYGKNSRKELTNGARLILMSLAIESVQDRLELYGNRAGKSDLTSLMMTVISEYKICSILPSDVMEMSNQAVSDRLKKKLKDSALIYEAYEAIMANTYCDPLDRISIAYEVLRQNNFFAGKTVAIDSFHSFTADEMKIISLSAEQSQDFYITLCRDINVNTDDSIFFFVNRTHSAIKQIAVGKGIKYEEINLPDGNDIRFKYRDLDCVEELIFRNEELECDTGDSIMLYEAEDIYDEAEQLARDIRKLTEDCYKYSDITIICRDSEMYRGIINSAFSKYDIPIFVSYPEKLESKPLMRLILSVLETATGNFSTENILTILKTGMTAIPDDDICMLENYAFLWDLKGSDWKKPFTKSIEGFVERNPEKSREVLNVLENHRQLVYNTITSMRDKMKNGDGADMTRAVYGMLEDFGSFERVKELSVYLEKSGEHILSEEEIRVWDMMIELLNTLYETLNGWYITPQKFYDLVKLIISQESISTIPITIDEVTLGNADTVRPGSPKVVFVIGAVDGVFPKTPSESGIFTNIERDELIAMSFPITDSIGRMFLQEEFFAYKSCSSASEKLFISRYLETVSGELTVESKIITEIKEIFPDITVRTKDDISLSDIVCSKSSALEQYALLKQRKPSISATIKECIKDYPELSGRISSTDRAFEKKPFMFREPDVSRHLFGNNMNISATQIEEYHHCPFRYFCQYGIKAKPNERAKFDPRQYGNAVHYIFERLLSPEYGVEKLASQSAEYRVMAVETVLDSYLEQLGGKDEKSATFMHLYKKIVSSAVIILDRLIAELTESEFKPSQVELLIGSESEPISYEILLPDGGKVFIRGKVDRVDEMKRIDESGKTTDYIRVIDYKTGEKQFVLYDVLCGINIQMLLYLSAITKNGSELFGDNIVPCGVLYMPSSTSYISTEKDNHMKTEDEIERERNNSLSMNGIIINNDEVINAMNGSGMFIKNKALRKSDDPPVLTCSPKELNIIFQKIDEIIVNMAENLHTGKIAAEPLMIKTGKKSNAINGCDFCPYDSICAYEEGTTKNIHIRTDNSNMVLESFHDKEDKEE